MFACTLAMRVADSVCLCAGQAVRVPKGSRLPDSGVWRRRHYRLGATVPRQCRTGQRVLIPSVRHRTARNR